jgi:hypothetical protein
VLRQKLTAGSRVITVRNLELGPGETRFTFTTDAPPTKPDDDTSGDVTFKMESPQLLFSMP